MNDANNESTFGCFLFFHRFTKWKDIAHGPIHNNEGGNVGYYIRQEKRCEKCGKVKLRDVDTK